MSSSDPLSFFAAGDSSSSDSEDEENERTVDKNENVSSETLDADKLPSPDSLFASVGKPSFLHDPGSRRVDWDKLVKNRTEPAEVNIHESEGGGRYAAIAPPTGTEEASSTHNKKVHSSLTAAIVNTYSTTSGEISSPPIRYSTKEVDPKFRTVSDRAEVGEAEDVPAPVAGKHSVSSSDRESSSSVKKQKTENFRQKEKRKRDEGQTSRGKSYVEEEKRILRQSFATDEVMS